MKVSLTTFIDFMFAASPVTKLRVVEGAKRQYEEDYDVKTDYYGLLRRCIVAVHENGTDRAALRALVRDVPPRKAQNYRACVDGYTKWMGRKKFAWVGGGPWPWRSGELTVSINPEIFVLMNDAPLIAKLYFKKDPLAPKRAGATLHLLEHAFGSDGAVGLIDVRRGKLLSNGSRVGNVEALLAGEAASFAEIWRRL